MTNSGYEMQLAEKDDRIAELQRKLANEQARDIHSCHPNCTREGCVNRRLRAELAAALAACKSKDEALLTCQTGDSSTGHVIHPSFDERLVESALAIQPHDSALKAWLGNPEWFCRKDANGVNVFYEDIEERPAGCTPLYSPKGLK